MIGEPILVMLIEDNIDHAELVIGLWRNTALATGCNISWMGNRPWITCFDRANMQNRIDRTTSCDPFGPAAPPGGWH